MDMGLLAARSVLVWPRRQRSEHSFRGGWQVGLTRDDVWLASVGGLFRFASAKETAPAG
jgi:hypothetical protein